MVPNNVVTKIDRKGDVSHHFQKNTHRILLTLSLTRQSHGTAEHFSHSFIYILYIYIHFTPFPNSPAFFVDQQSQNHPKPRFTHPCLLLVAQNEALLNCQENGISSSRGRSSVYMKRSSVCVALLGTGYLQKMTV